MRSSKECVEWYNDFKANNYIWNFEQQIKKYCLNDVIVLTIAVMEFRKLFKNFTGLDPITRRFTLAGVGLEYFRAKILKDNMIGVTPINGYIDGRHKSNKGNVWLDWMEEKRGVKICREMRIGQNYADGCIRDGVLGEIFEFNGCYWHGCQKCTHLFSLRNTYDGNEQVDPIKDYQRTIEKETYYKSRGFKVTSIWEHDFDKLLTTDVEFKAFHKKRMAYYKTIDKIGHANIRESFYGGRTNNLYFNADSTGTELIKYKDVCSLYPTVLSKCEYPIGHPSIISKFIDTSIYNYFGFIKCKVLPPKDLYIPVLPLKSETKKLVFALCNQCAKDMSPNKCSHSDKERAISSTWYSEELKLAIEMGYKILKIYEVLHYERKTNEIFKPYIQQWLKLKTEASGWPDNCTTDELKRNYISEYQSREGVDLEFNKMSPNPGLRFIAKLMLNSLWGKLAQRPNQKQTKLCKTYDAYRSIISDAKIQIKGEIMPNDETILVNYQYIDDNYSSAGNTNIALASMVTGNARIHLYRELHNIESSAKGRVLYFDTDSVIYRHDPTKGWYDPPIGDFLGDMTDEIEKDYKEGSYINSFTSCGPKNYGYQVVTGDGRVIQKVKVKGISITEEVKHKINFERVKETAQHYFNNTPITTLAPQLCFRSDKLHNVTTNKVNKIYQAVSEKRRIVRGHPIYQTVPYGFYE
ncbi:uncharacterized protein LOC128951450 [Oppia nitens]|uniref:uncharacterized protein LOC128951450 n=1 Tax=Oppia nitens TaxID=1686743 RepID=UPI0023DA2BE3|nr:uncharacterized protein LOC128951450 [Oppia nitens]